MNHILLVDGMALLFRGFYATAFRRNFMENTNGVPTNGIFQYMRYLFHAIHKFQPTHVISCWDLGKDTFRTELYESYKANREDPPKALVPQFSLVKKVMAAYQIPNVSLKNYEADDCIGTLAETYKNEHLVTILSGDQDFRQLVDKHVQLALMLRGQGNYQLYTNDNFYDLVGITPEQIIDKKALMGDSADNYPGVKGIGKKTALKFIKQYGSIDRLLESMDGLTESMQKRLTDNLEILYLSKELATIKRQLPLKLPVEQALFAYEEATVRERLKKLALEHVMV